MDHILFARPGYMCFLFVCFVLTQFIFNYVTHEVSKLIQ